MIILSGDIGGTHSRIAYYDVNEGRFDPVVEQVYPSIEYTGLEEIIRKFVDSHGQKCMQACFGVAGPVHNGRARITNLPWIVDSARLKEGLKLDNVTVINDLEAIAYSVPVLAPKDYAILNEGEQNPPGNAAVIAAGTGLGEAGLYWDGTRRVPFACEGGHCDFSPADEIQDDLLRHLRAQFGHVSWERMVCGPGLVNIYEFLRDVRDVPEPDWLKAELRHGDRASQISRHGIDGTNPLCVQALELFVSLYGSEAGNLALKIMATGGVYLGGGIAPKIIEKLRAPDFMRAFCTKGRMSDLLKAIPVRVIVNDKAGLIGSAYCATLKLQGIKAI